MTKIETKVEETKKKYHLLDDPDEYSINDALTEAIHYGILIENERIREGLPEPMQDRPIVRV